jgi:dolichol kinase
LESSELDKGGRIAGALTGFCIGLSVLSTLSFLSLFLDAFGGMVGEVEKTRHGEKALEM